MDMCGVLTARGEGLLPQTRCEHVHVRSAAAPMRQRVCFSNPSPHTSIYSPYRFKGLYSYAIWQIS